MVFPVVMYGCESWTIKKAESQRTVVLKTLENPLDCKEIKPGNPKGNQPCLYIESVARRGTPCQGPKLGSCRTLGNELSEETHVLTKQEILLGKGTRVDSSRVRETGKTALAPGLQSWVL